MFFCCGPFYFLQILGTLTKKRIKTTAKSKQTQKPYPYKKLKLALSTYQWLYQKKGWKETVIPGTTNSYKNDLAESKALS